MENEKSAGLANWQRDASFYKCKSITWALNEKKRKNFGPKMGSVFYDERQQSEK